MRSLECNSKSTEPSDERLQQQHRTILNPDRWQVQKGSEDAELDEIDIHNIGDTIFHQIAGCCGRFT